MVDGAAFLTVKDLATRWALSERRIRDMALGQEIPSMRVGKVWRFPAERIAAWERANTR